MAEPKSAGSLDVHLHPLVLLNVSDQWTRHKVQSKSGRVCSALLGSIEGRRLDIHTSFELLVECPDDISMHMDDEFFQTRLSQFAEVFPNYDFVGWCSVGNEPNKQDLCMLRRLEQLNENPYFLLLDPEAPEGNELQGNKLLPVKMYERKLQVVGGTTSSGFQPVNYVIDTGEAERISVAHVAKNATHANSEQQSDYTLHLGSTLNAVSMLSSRISVLKAYLQDVKDGSIPKNHAILRDLLSVCNSIRATQTTALREELYRDFNDALLTVLLSTITKSACQLGEVLDKFLVMNEKKSRNRNSHGSLRDMRENLF